MSETLEQHIDRRIADAEILRKSHGVIGLGVFATGATASYLTGESGFLVSGSAIGGMSAIFSARYHNAIHYLKGYREGLGKDNDTEADKTIVSTINYQTMTHPPATPEQVRDMYKL